MKYGRFLKKIITIYFISTLALFAQELSADIDDFLDDPSAPQSYEEIHKTNFGVIDQISKQKKKISEKLNWKIPSLGKERVFTETRPYTAQLKKGSILTSIATGKKVKIYRSLIVKARETFVGSHQTYIFNKDGKIKYTTKAINTINIENTIALSPSVDPLVVYDNKLDYQSVDEELSFATYLALHIESINTSYYANLYRGQSQSAQSYTFEAKTYLLTQNTPYNFGINLQYQFGNWQDPVIGTVTWQALHIGPSFMTSFWKKKKGRWNLHLNLFKSIFHNTQKDPYEHSFSSVGTQVELEKLFYTHYGKYSIGVKYSWLNSSLNSTTEYLENIANRGVISSFGAYINYNFGWSI